MANDIIVFTMPDDIVIFVAFDDIVTLNDITVFLMTSSCSQH